MFDQATRLKIRFESPKGLITAEDLWDLPLTSAAGKPNLDTLAQSLHKQIKETAEESFVVTSKKPDDILKLKFDIVLHIINVKKAENAAAHNAGVIARERIRLTEVLARIQEKKLENSTEEEVLKAIAALDSSPVAVS